MIDLPNDSDIVTMCLYKDGQKLLMAADDGRGFIANASDLLAQTKNGKQVLNVSGETEALMAYELGEGHDMLAVIGQNRKLLVFSLDEMPEMGRGKGVILQKYKDGGLSDAKSFKLEEGLSFPYGSGERVVDDLTPWHGKRAQAGRMPPNGFPRNNKFG